MEEMGMYLEGRRGLLSFLVQTKGEKSKHNMDYIEVDDMDDFQPEPEHRLSNRDEDNYMDIELRRVTVRIENVQNYTEDEMRIALKIVLIGAQPKYNLHISSIKPARSPAKYMWIITMDSTEEAYKLRRWAHGRPLPNHAGASLAAALMREVPKLSIKMSTPHWLAEEDNELALGVKVCNVLEGELTPDEEKNNEQRVGLQSSSADAALNIKYYEKPRTVYFKINGVMASEMARHIRGVDTNRDARIHRLNFRTWTGRVAINKNADELEAYAAAWMAAEKHGAGLDEDAARAHGAIVTKATVTINN